MPSVAEQMEAVGKLLAASDGDAIERWQAVAGGLKAWPALTELVRAVDAAMDHGLNARGESGIWASSWDERRALTAAVQALAAALPPVPSEENPDAR